MSKRLIDQIINRAGAIERAEQRIAEQAYKVWTPKPGYREAARVVAEFTNGNLTEETMSTYLQVTNQEFWIRLGREGSLHLVNSKGTENIELGKKLYNEGGAVRPPEVEEVIIERRERYG